jgi:hypothetical protein
VCIELAEPPRAAQPSKSTQRSAPGWRLATDATASAGRHRQSRCAKLRRRLRRGLRDRIAVGCHGCYARVTAFAREEASASPPRTRLRWRDSPVSGDVDRVWFAASATVRSALPLSTWKPAVATHRFPTSLEVDEVGKPTRGRDRFGSRRGRQTGDRLGDAAIASVARRAWRCAGRSGLPAGCAWSWRLA